MGMTETTLVPIQPPWVNKIAHVKLCEPYLKTGVLAIGLTAKPKTFGQRVWQCRATSYKYMITYKKSVETMGDEYSPVGWG